MYIIATLSIFGIDVLEYSDVWITREWTQYESPRFLLKGLKQYKNRVVVIYPSGLCEISVKEGNGDMETSLYLMENEDFRKQLYKKYPNSK